MQRVLTPPVVLIIAGNDPSGGAGLAADIQAVAAMGGYPAPVVAALTVQDAVDARRVEPVAAALVVEQAAFILDRMPVAAIKLGLLATAETGSALAKLLSAHPSVPIVVDPVLRAGGGTALAEVALLEIYRRALFPLAALATPNGAEVQRLAPNGIGELLGFGARQVLTKGADDGTPDVVNVLHGTDGSRREFRWPRLPGHYHGSGCTLASAIAALLAQGIAVPEAVEQAQGYTWRTLQAAWQIGAGQRLPNRNPSR